MVFRAKVRYQYRTPAAADAQAAQTSIKKDGPSMTSHVCPLRNQRDKPARRFAAFAAMLCFTPFLYADDAVDHAKELLQSAPVFDGHNDLPWVYREYFDGDVEGYDISVKAQYDTDIPRLRAGGVGAQFWSVYVPTSLSPLRCKGCVTRSSHDRRWNA
jgi:hypothetical protein